MGPHGAAAALGPGACARLGGAVSLVLGEQQLFLGEQYSSISLSGESITAMAVGYLVAVAASVFCRAGL